MPIGYFMITTSNTNTDGTKDGDCHINSISSGTITREFYMRGKHSWTNLYNACWIYRLENVSTGSVLKYTIGDNDGMHIAHSYSIFKLQ